jgi:hypothetical protein
MKFLIRWFSPSSCYLLSHNSKYSHHTLWIWNDVNIKTLFLFIVLTVVMQFLWQKIHTLFVPVTYVGGWEFIIPVEVCKVGRFYRAGQGLPAPVFCAMLNRINTRERTTLGGFDCSSQWPGHNVDCCGSRADSDPKTRRPNRKGAKRKPCPIRNKSPGLLRKAF